MSDARFAARHAALDNERMINPTIAIAFCNAVVHVLVTLRIDVEDDHRPYLHRFTPRTG